MDREKDLGLRSRQDKGKDSGLRAQQAGASSHVAREWGQKGSQCPVLKVFTLTGRRDFTLRVLTLHFKVTHTIPQPLDQFFLEPRRNFNPKGLECIHPTSSLLAIGCLGRVSILTLITQ